MSAVKTALVSLAVALSLAMSFTPAAGQDSEPPSLAWQPGPATAPIGSSLAEIDVPEGFVYLDGQNTAKFMELIGNPVSGSEKATVASASDDESWFVVFEWDPIGWVDDSEKEDLDADSLLESIKEGTEAANEERRKRGWQTLEILGWYERPKYDEVTNNLTWAIEGQSGEDRVLNRNIKLLGRRGVMTATLVASPEELSRVSPITDELLANYRFQEGNRYAEFIPGKDTVAKYGLTALIAGGAGAALVKSGLLARFWKLLVLAAVGVAVWLRRLFGGKAAEPTAPTET